MPVVGWPLPAGRYRIGPPRRPGFEVDQQRMGKCFLTHKGTKNPLASPKGKTPNIASLIWANPRATPTPPSCLCAFVRNLHPWPSIPRNARWPSFANSCSLTKAQRHQEPVGLAQRKNPKHRLFDSGKSAGHTSPSFVPLCLCEKPPTMAIDPAQRSMTELCEFMFSHEGAKSPRTPWPRPKQNPKHRLFDLGKSSGHTNPCFEPL